MFGGRSDRVATGIRSLEIFICEMTFQTQELFNLLRACECGRTECITRVHGVGVRRMQVVNTDSENEIQWHNGIEFNIVRILDM